MTGVIWGRFGIREDHYQTGSRFTCFNRSLDTLVSDLQQFRPTCWSALHFPSHSERRKAFFFFAFWLWGGILSAVMLSNAYFKMHESTLIWIELFILWFLNILLLRCLRSWSNWKIHGWIWNGINKNQGFLSLSKFCAELYQTELKSFWKHWFLLPFIGHFKY